jgi:tagatose 6-phosphate kinase
MILSVTMNPSQDKVYIVNDFSIQNVHRTNEYTATAGGKGLNVARVVKSLDKDIVATGLLGGLSGTFIDNSLKEYQIKNEFVKISGETRTCINIIDHKNTTTTEILEAGPEIKKSEIKRFINRYKKLVKKADIITLSGSLPRGLNNNFYFELIDHAKKLDKKVILDTSGQYLKEGIKGKPFMVKPNEDEIKELFGEKYKKPSDYTSALEKLKELGIKLPIITLGKNGAVGMIRDKYYHFKLPEIEVVNTVGSGDAFVAGCAVGLQKNNIFDTIKLGMACGTANTLFIKTGKVTKQKVNQFRDKIEVVQI